VTRSLTVVLAIVGDRTKLSRPEEQPETSVTRNCGRPALIKLSRSGTGKRFDLVGKTQKVSVREKRPTQLPTHRRIFGV
jgi:hypothetical protein